MITGWKAEIIYQVNGMFSNVILNISPGRETTATSSAGATQEKVQPIRLSSEISAIADQLLAYTPHDQAK